MEKGNTLETIKPKITLHFLRHGKKQAIQEGVSDYKIDLTLEGAEEVICSSEVEDISQVAAYGSKRARALKTAAFRLLGRQKGVFATDTLEALKKEFPGKIRQDDRLDIVFPADDYKKHPYTRWIFDQYEKGRLLKSLVEESDDKAKEYADEKTITYRRAAAGIAIIVKRYMTASSRFAGSKKAERIFVSHETVTECFLAKVIEKTAGVAKRDGFIAALNNTGFDFIEGFSVDIEKMEGKQQVRVSFSKLGSGDNPSFVFDAMVGEELIDEIIKEGEL